MNRNIRCALEDVCISAERLKKDVLALGMVLADAKPSRRVEILKALVSMGIDPHDLVMREEHWQTDPLMRINAVVPDMQEREWDWRARTCNPALDLMAAAKVRL